jgi:hypothetical protein
VKGAQCRTRWQFRGTGSTKSARIEGTEVPSIDDLPDLSGRRSGRTSAIRSGARELLDRPIVASKDLDTPLLRRHGLGVARHHRGSSLSTGTLFRRLWETLRNARSSRRRAPAAPELNVGLIGRRNTVSSRKMVLAILGEDS